MNKLILRFLFLFFLVPSISCVDKNKDEQGCQLPSYSDVIAMIDKVNTYWQQNNSPETRSFWDNAAYHTGNMEAYKLTAKEEYRAYSEAWAIHNEWKGAKEPDKSKWVYSYGESDEYVLFGDYQICFQVYADLYSMNPNPEKIARALEVMEYQMSTPQNDYWWWADGLYMVMPVMTRLYKITGKELYLDKLYEYFSYANSIMYDEEEGLYYRDAKYIYPEHKTPSGKKDFWARGDGWVFAAFAQVLKDLPETDKHRAEYIKIYEKMAAALKPLQQEGGYWTRSMMDTEHAPGPETSGTAFFTYGYLWGINNGYLDKETYLPVVTKAWEYLTTVALQEDGRLGYVQPIGERAIPGQVVDASSTANFGVGAFLLAASEMARYANNIEQNTAFLPGAIWKDDNGKHINAHGGGIVYAGDTYYWFGEHKSDHTSAALKGVTCYSSKDLLNWKNEGIALAVEAEGSGSEIERGCVLERPKVVYNEKTGTYVMWFHLELKGQGYAAARVGMATSQTPVGPYIFQASYRPNAGLYPENMSEEQKKSNSKPDDFKEWWTPEWRKAVEEGLFVHRDFEGGQMSRDMTVYVDDDKKAYHIYSSEENLTLHIAELTDDYQKHTGRYIRIFPGGHNEAPAIFKKEGVYYMITSGCTGWDPNEARMFSSKSIWGPWEQHPNPCVGNDADLTFHSQSTFILPVEGKKNVFIFMGDRWTPKYPSNARYIWLPVQFDETGMPKLEWKEKWNVSELK